MRNPERIKRILDKIEFIWSKFPELRFHQMLTNSTKFPLGDLYFFEDDEFEIILDKEIEKIKNG